MKNFIRRSCMYFVALFLVLGVALFVPGSSVFATPGGETGNYLTVTASVVGSCSVDAASLNFGNYNPVSTSPLNGHGTINVNCTNGENYYIELNGGYYGEMTLNGNYAMISSGNASYLGYNLSTTPNSAGRISAHSYIPNWSGKTGNGGQQSYTIYGQITAGQTSGLAGSHYQDTVTITVYYSGGEI